MPQRRPPTDSEPLEVTDEQIEAVWRHLDAITDFESRVIAKLYGKLPAWLPEPILPQIRQAIASLRNAQQSPERIAEIVERARAEQLEDAPGTALDVTDFFKSAHYLAHVQWALSLDKADAIKALAGRVAAKNYLRSKRGNEALYGTEPELQSRNRNIHLQAAALRKRNKDLKNNGIAERLAPAFGLSTKQLNRILRAGPPAKK